MPSVHRNPGSPFWTASVRVWIAMPDHPAGGFFRRSRRSTGLPLTEPKQKAVAVAREFEYLSLAARDATHNPERFFESAVARLMLTAGVERRQKRQTWADYSAQWLAERKVSHHTRAAYGISIGHVTRHLRARARADLRDLTHTDFQSLATTLQESGRSSTTTKQIIGLARAICERARLQGYLDRNPVALVVTDNAAGAKRDAFSIEEIAAIFAHCDREWRIACLFGLCHGLRLRDATRRRFEEIRPEGARRVLRFVPQKKQRRGNAITLPLVGELAQLHGTGPITPRLATEGNPSRSFMKILHKAGVMVEIHKARGAGHSMVNKSFHSWRHTCNTMLANAGVDGRLRQLISDHESSRMNARYTHPSLDAMAEAIGRAILPAATDALR